MNNGYETGFASALNKMVDTIVLSVLWLVCSIPVFTLGAASSAAYYAYHKSVRQNRSYVWKEFFTAFKANFKKATGVWLILMLFLALSLVTCYFLYLMRELVPFAGVCFTMGSVIVGFVIVWCIYLFAYLSRFENTLSNSMQNSALLVASNLLWSILLLVLFVVAVFVIIVRVILCVPVIAVYIWLVNKILERIFRKLMTVEERISELQLDAK